MLLKMSFGNLIKHKWSSLVLLGIFFITTFVIYWVFGFGNSFSTALEEDIRSENGDLSYFIEFEKKEDINKLLADRGFHKIAYSSMIEGIINSPKENFRSGVEEMTPKRKNVLEKTKLTVGRLPEKADEIVISDYHRKPKLEVGDTLYISTFTPEKIANAVRFTVVGIGAIGHHMYVTPDGMTTILNGNNYANKVKIYVSEELGEKESIKSLYEHVKLVFEENDIEIERSQDIYTNLDGMKFMTIILTGSKMLLLAILFPLIGAVIGALVWIHAYKRRKEMWTYVAMGFRDTKIRNMMMFEYTLIAVIGITVGLIVAAISAGAAERAGSRISIGYIMSILVSTKMGVLDVLAIYAFYLISLFAWVRVPLNKIIKDKVFSY